MIKYIISNPRCSCLMDFLRSEKAQKQVSIHLLAIQSIHFLHTPWTFYVFLQTVSNRELANNSWLSLRWSYLVRVVLYSFHSVCILISPFISWKSFLFPGEYRFSEFDVLILFHLGLSDLTPLTHLPKFESRHRSDVDLKFALLRLLN